MRRKLFVIIPVVLMCTAGAFADDYKVKVSQNYPRVVKPGDSFTITFNIQKTIFMGFARLQQNLPEGFTPEVIDSHGSEFVFKDGTINFSWIQLPPENDFNISYKIKTDKSLNGSQIIKGTFLYMDEGKTQKMPISPAVVNLENLTGESEPAPEVKRQLINTTSGRNEYRVELTMKPNGITESARFSDDIPDGYTAELIDAHGAAFIFQNHSANFEWKNFPDETSFKVVYLVRSESQTGTPVINGVLVYGDEAVASDDQAQQETTKSEDFSENKKDTPVEVMSPEKKQEEVKPEMNTAPVATTPVKPKQSSAATAGTATQTPPSSVPQNDPSPVNGIIFRVQISATQHSTAKDSKWFDEKYHINQAVELTQHEGWKKYLIGSFRDYRDASSFKKETRDKISDAFVVAYQDGVRISVEDAMKTASLNQNSDIPATSYNKEPK